MDSVNLMTIVQGLAAALLAYAGVRYTARRAATTAETAQESSDLKTVSEEWRLMKEHIKVEAEEDRQRYEARLATLETEVKAEREHSVEQDKEIRTLRDALGLWSRWADHLIRNWSEVRQQESPPQPPQTPLDN